MTKNPTRELAMMLGIKLAGAVAIGYVVYLIVGSIFQKEEHWPPNDAEDEARIVAAYKRNLQISDSPLTPRKPEDVPVFLSRIIDHDVKTGDLKSARQYANDAIDRKVDGQVEKLATFEPAKQLVAQVLSARLKQEDLNHVLTRFDQRPPEKVDAAVKEKYNRELAELVEQFRRTPFDAAACPEQAAAMAKLYQPRQEALRKDPRMRIVVDEVERNCLPK